MEEVLDILWKMEEDYAKSLGVSEIVKSILYTDAGFCNYLNMITEGSYNDVLSELKITANKGILFRLGINDTHLISFWWKKGRITPRLRCIRQTIKRLENKNFPGQ